MNSLFRIDRNLVSHNRINPSKVVVIPEIEIPEDSTPDDLELDEIQNQGERVDALLDQKINEKKQELRQLIQDMEEAKLQALQVVQEAEQEAVVIKEDAMQTGYQEGMERAREEYEAEIKTLKSEVHRLTSMLKKSTDAAYQQIQDSVLDFSLFIAEKVIQTELDRDDQAYLNMVREVIAQVKSDNSIVLRVNGADYDRFFANDADDFVSLLKSSGVEIRKDFKMEPAECCVETEYGTLRSGVRMQLQKMAHLLREAE